jgi:hypothetical protein
MNAIEFRDYILKQMTAEKALLLLLEGQVREYAELKFSSDENAIHPILLISMAAMEMNWQMAIPESGDNDIQGMILGTEEYIESVLDENHQYKENFQSKKNIIDKIITNEVIEKAQKHVDTYNYKHNIVELDGQYIINFKP